MSVLASRKCLRSVAEPSARDYTHGPMNMAVFIVPSLQDDSQAAAACNCLLNTSVWEDDDQYFYTYVSTRASSMLV